MSRPYTKHPGRGGVLRAEGVTSRWRQRRSDGVAYLTHIARIKRPDGQWMSIGFYVGTENTYTKRRDLEQLRAAKELRRAFEHWYAHGGRHPMPRRKRQ